MDHHLSFQSHTSNTLKCTIPCYLEWAAAPCSNETAEPGQVRQHRTPGILIHISFPHLMVHSASPSFLWLLRLFPCTTSGFFYPFLVNAQLSPDGFELLTGDMVHLQIFPQPLSVLKPQGAKRVSYVPLFFWSCWWWAFFLSDSFIILDRAYCDAAVPWNPRVNEKAYSSLSALCTPKTLLIQTVIG